MNQMTEVNALISQIANAFQENWQAALSRCDRKQGEQAMAIGRGELQGLLAEIYPIHFAANIADEVFRNLEGECQRLSKEEALEKVTAAATHFIKDVLSDFHRNYGHALLRFGDDEQYFSRSELEILMGNWGIPEPIADDVLTCIFASGNRDRDERVSWGEARAQVPYFYVHYFR